MPRKKAKFKNLGTLPKGEWTVMFAKASGAIILCSAGTEPPMVISDGKLTTLNLSMKGKTDAPTEES